MPIFAPKKKELPEVPEKVPEVPTAEELKEIARKLRELTSVKGEEKPKAPIKEELKEIAERIEEVPKEEVEEEKPPERIAGPPLFIKLERYHRILRYISELRRGLFMTKSIISTLAEIEKLREDNAKLLLKTVERIDSRLAEIDKELLRPRELPTEYPEEVTEVGSMEAIVSDLKGRLQSLKDELESIL